VFIKLLAHVGRLSTLTVLCSSDQEGRRRLAGATKAYQLVASNRGSPIRQSSHVRHRRAARQAGGGDRAQLAGSNVRPAVEGVE